MCRNSSCRRRVQKSRILQNEKSSESKKKIKNIYTTYLKLSKYIPHLLFQQIYLYSQNYFISTRM